MKYVKNYQDFRRYNQHQVNEELFGLRNLLATATGAFKNFLSNIAAPFKTASDSFNKEMKPEDAKKNLVTTIDNIAKASIDNINKAEDEKQITDIKDAFRKQISDQMMDFDKKTKEAAAAKSESLIYRDGDLIIEAVSDTKLRIVTAFKTLSDLAGKYKEEYDKKFAAAKDLPAKKAAAVEEIKKITDDTKKLLNDDKAFAAAIDKYKADNKIEGGASGEAELFKSYGVAKKEELVGKEVNYKMKGYDNNKKQDEQKDKVGKLKVLKVTPDGLFFDGDKEDFEKKMDEILPNSKVEGQEDLVKTLGDIKTVPDAIPTMAKIAQKIKEDPKTIQDLKKITGAGDQK